MPEDRDTTSVYQKLVKYARIKILNHAKRLVALILNLLELG